MPLPEATVTILDGALGQLPPSIANASVKLGICSDGLPNTLYSLADSAGAQTSLGQGPLTEAVVDTLGVAGGPVYAMPLNPTTQGTVGSVTHLGPGTGTVTPSRAPAKVIDVKITTGGALGTMAFQVRLNGGAYASPVTSVAGGSYAYLVPGTVTTITFTAATYVLNDVYTVAVSGAITVSGTGPAGNLTQASSPLDTYSVLVTITTGGAIGTAVFTYSLDGGVNTSAGILVPGGSGIYAIPNTGVVLTFASTFTAGDTYAFTTTTAQFSNSDVTTAMTAVFGSPLEWAWTHVVGQGANSAAAVSLAAVLDAQMTIAESSFRYVFGHVECATMESDSTVASTFSSFVSSRISVSAGDIAHVSGISGRVIRRNAGIVYTSRLAAIRPAEHPGRIDRGPLKNVRSLYRDESKTQLLDANRFVTLRTEVGQSGYFVTRGNMMAAGGSDFSSVMNRRVMDVGCRVARAAALLFLNRDVKVDKKTGFIFDPEAAAIESFINAQLTAALVNTDNASDVSVVVSRTEPILTTKRLPISIRITPKGYAESIPVTIGLLNPAVLAA